MIITPTERADEYSMVLSYVRANLIQWDERPNQCRDDAGLIQVISHILSTEGLIEAVGVSRPIKARLDGEESYSQPKGERNDSGP